MEITLLKYNNDSLKIVFSSGEFLILPIDCSCRSFLSKGTIVTSEQFEQMSYEANVYSAKKKLLRYLTASDKSIFDCKRYLIKRNFDKDVIDIAINYLLDKGYLDDSRFAKKYVSYLLRTKKVGRKYIEGKLYQKGISKNEISLALDEIMPENHAEKIIFELAIKKIESLSGKKNKMQKVVYFLTSRGFSSKEIFKAIDHLKERGLISS